MFMLRFKKQVEKIRKAIIKLPKEEVFKLNEELHKYTDTFTMMGASETASKEWLDTEEDIYNDDV